MQGREIWKLYSEKQNERQGGKQWCSTERNPSAERMQLEKATPGTIKASGLQKGTWEEKKFQTQFDEKTGLEERTRMGQMQG